MHRSSGPHSTFWRSTEHRNRSGHEPSGHQTWQILGTWMEAFEQRWPEGFCNTILKNTNTMATSHKFIKVSENKVIKPEAIYARAMGLLIRSTGIDTKTLLVFELSPVPTAMIDEHGWMRLVKSKSNLKNAIQVEVPQESRDTWSLYSLMLVQCFGWYLGHQVLRLYRTMWTGSETTFTRSWKQVMSILSLTGKHVTQIFKYPSTGWINTGYKKDNVCVCHEKRSCTTMMI